jgi:hypothetical protein
VLPNGDVHSGPTAFAATAAQQQLLDGDSKTPNGDLYLQVQPDSPAILTCKGSIHPTAPSGISINSMVSTWSDRLPETLGIVTLEDVIEELLQQEIVDETDKFVDNMQQEAVNRGQQMRALPPQLQLLMRGKSGSFTTLPKSMHKRTASKGADTSIAGSSPRSTASHVTGANVSVPARRHLFKSKSSRNIERPAFTNSLADIPSLDQRSSSVTMPCKPDDAVDLVQQRSFSATASRFKEGAELNSDSR